MVVEWWLSGDDELVMVVMEFVRVVEGGRKKWLWRMKKKPRERKEKRERKWIFYDFL
jgi:hypothetical protein